MQKLWNRKRGRNRSSRSELKTRIKGAEFRVFPTHKLESISGIPASKLNFYLTVENPLGAEVPSGPHFHATLLHSRHFLRIDVHYFQHTAH